MDFLPTIWILNVGFFNNEEIINAIPITANIAENPNIIIDEPLMKGNGLRKWFINKTKTTDEDFIYKKIETSRTFSARILFFAFDNLDDSAQFF